MEPGPTIAQEVAAFLVGTELADIPDRVLDVMRDDVVDIAGCVLWGHETPWGRAMVEHLDAAGEAPQVSVWGTPLRVSPGSAALALGTLGHSFDFDDYHPEAKLHPATVVLPAVLALGDALGSSGREVLRAATLGFEVMIRLSLASGPVATMLSGFHLTGICGSVGAAAGAALLLGLDQRQTAHALGLAATQSSGLMGFLHDGSESKRLHAGRAAQSGILAAQLARRGYTGPARVFELDHGGFCSAFSPEPRPEAMLTALGERWTAGEVSLKRYSCCGSIHSTLDLVAQGVEELGVAPTDVDEIEVRHSSAVIQQCGWEYVPADVLHAQMSIQYCVAALLAEGAVLPEQFRAELLDDPDLLALAKRVRFTADPEIEALYPAKFASRVVVRAGGQERDLRTLHPKGAPEHPLDRTEIDEKFDALASRRLGRERRAAVVREARRLQDVDDIRAFTGLLVAESGGE